MISDCGGVGFLRSSDSDQRTIRCARKGIRFPNVSPAFFSSISLLAVHVVSGPAEPFSYEVVVIYDFYSRDIVSRVP